MSDNKNEEPYNVAAYGYSPFDMDASECRYWAIDHISDDLDNDDYDDDDDYDCCDDAEDYGEDDADDNAEND